MSYLDEILSMKKPPKKARAEQPKRSAEVVVYPQGASLGIAKAERTKAQEIDRAFQRAERRPIDPLLALGVGRDGYWTMGPGGGPVRETRPGEYDLFKDI